MDLHLSKKQRLLCSALAASFCLFSCQSLQDYFTSSSQHPPQEYLAADGKYFPDFIRNFFPASDLFSASYPTIPLAKENMLIIEVRRLQQAQSSHNEANLSWSADSQYLGYEVITNRERKILVKNLPGDYSKELAAIANKQTDFLYGMVPEAVRSYNAGLRWAADRSEFVFMSNGGQGLFNLYVGGIEKEQAPIAESRTKDGYAVWNPKQRQIAFVSARSGNGDIYLADLNKSSPERLSSSELFDLFPEWFPDGQSLVYCSGNTTNHNLMLVSKKDSLWQSPRKLTDWGGDDLRPTVSPNGRYIAFYSAQARRDGQESPQWNLHVIPYVPGKVYNNQDLLQTIVARDVVVDLNTGIAWTPDGHKIFYVKKDPKIFNPIMGYDLRNGKQYILKTDTKMNRDLMMSSMGILSFRAQVGAWDRVFLALTNQGRQLQTEKNIESTNFKIVYPETSHADETQAND